MTDGLQLKNIEILRLGQVLLSLDLHIRPGTVGAVMGPSGAGKSTLLAAIAGQLPPEFTLSGEITLDGRSLRRLPAQARRVGILYQDHLLFPHMSVGANLAFGLDRRVPRHSRRAAVDQALEDIGLAGFHDRDPETLSGGQKARIALMRMLLSEPDLLLLDEPFSGLDASLRDQIRRLVFALARRRHLPVLLVTHDEGDALAANAEIVRL